MARCAATSPVGPLAEAAARPSGTSCALPASFSGRVSPWRASPPASNPRSDLQRRQFPKRAPIRPRALASRLPQEAPPDSRAARRPRPSSDAILEPMSSAMDAEMADAAAPSAAAPGGPTFNTYLTLLGVDLAALDDKEKAKLYECFRKGADYVGVTPHESGCAMEAVAVASSASTACASASPRHSTHSRTPRRRRSRRRRTTCSVPELHCTQRARQRVAFHTERPCAALAPNTAGCDGRVGCWGPVLVGW